MCEIILPAAGNILRGIVKVRALRAGTCVLLRGGLVVRRK